MNTNLNNTETLNILLVTIYDEVEDTFGKRLQTYLQHLNCPYRLIEAKRMFFFVENMDQYRKQDIDVVLLSRSDENGYLATKNVDIGLIEKKLTSDEVKADVKKFCRERILINLSTKKRIDEKERVKTINELVERVLPNKSEQNLIEDENEINDPSEFPLRTFENLTNEKDFESLSRILHSLSLVKNNKKVQQLIEGFEISNSPEDFKLIICDLEMIPYHLKLPKFKGLKRLSLDRNNIRKIEFLDNLQDLETLNLSQNQISKIENIDSLSKLTKLDIEHNQLEDISELVKNKGLEWLGLSTNKITNLSPLIALTNLRTLYASRNLITDITPITQLNSLSRTVLVENKIESLLPLLSFLKANNKKNESRSIKFKYALDLNEKGIFLYGNPISDPPIEYVQKGNSEIISYLEKGNKYGRKKIEILKIILVGNSGVGKTNLSELLLKKTISKKHNSTDTLEITTFDPIFLKNAEGKAIKVNLFDFGGQDYFHDLHRLYYSHDTLYILMWETATNLYQERTENLIDGTTISFDDYPIRYWLESINFNLKDKKPIDYKDSENSHEIIKDLTTYVETLDGGFQELKKDLTSTAPVLLLQNKIDLGEGLLNQISLRNKYGNISSFQSVSLSKKKRIKIIHEVIAESVEKLHISGRTLVKYHYDIILEFINSSHKFEILNKSDFKNLLVRLSPINKSYLTPVDADSIARILGNLGYIYYHDKGENSIAFTNIRDFNIIVRNVFAKAKLGLNKGKFSFADVATINYIEDILMVLLDNNSLIKLNDHDYLVPQFLPANAESDISEFVNAFVHCHIKYVYTAYFHKSILMNLFSQFVGVNQEGFNSSIKGISYWRNGIVLSEKNGTQTNMLFVNFVKTSKECFIELRTLYPYTRNSLENQVETALDALNSGWSHSKRVSIDSISFFDINTMIINAEQNKKYLFKGEGDKTFSVNNFKHLVEFKNHLPKKLFVSYSSKNGDFVKRFWTHLDILKTTKSIEPWYDRKIELGTKWDQKIKYEMETSDLIIFLISPDFLATPYIMNEEVPNAIKLEKDGKCKLLFIQLTPSLWEDTVLNEYQQYLDSSKAEKLQHLINTPNNDQAWKEVIKEIKEKLGIKSN